MPPVNIRLDDVDRALDHVRHAAEETPALQLELGPPRTFFPSTPVVYLAVGGDLDELERLRGRLLSGPLAEPDGRARDRPFVPHLTLDQSISPERIGAALETLSHYRASVAFGRAVVLEFSEEERRWKGLSDAPFGRPRLVGRGGIEIELAVSESLDPEGEGFQGRVLGDHIAETYGEGVGRDEPFAITARIAGEIVATATGELRGELVRIGDLVVARQWRSHGIGTKLLQEIESLAVDHQALKVRLEVQSGSRAEAFYVGRGYEAVALLPGWRHGRDFTVMEHTLTSR